MPRTKLATLTSWSFSVYTQYLKCPYSVCLEKIKRIRVVEEEKSPALVKGDKAHAIAEEFVSGLGSKRPALVQELPAKPGDRPVVVDVTAIKARLVELRKTKVRTEQEWAFTREYTPTGWFDKDAWLRMKTDICGDTVEPPTVSIVDWKTGRVYEDHKQQRSLYALGGLQLVQIGALAGGNKAVELTAQHVYVDTGQSATEKFLMKHLAPLKREWAARIEQMMKDTAYKPKTGPHCRWCKFRKSAGGPCPENQ